MIAGGGAVTDAAGELVGTIGTLVDITERKRLEKTVAASAALLARAEAMVHVGTWSLNLTSNKVTASEEVYRMHGLDPKGANEVTDPQTFLALVQPDDRAVLQQRQLSHSAGGVQDEVDFRVVRPDGSERVLRARHDVVFDEAGAPVTLVGVTWDVTERKRLETATKESAALLAEAAALAHVGSWSLNIAANELSVSEEYCRIHGLDSEDVKGTLDLLAIRAFVHVDDRAMVERALEKSLKEDVHDELEVRIVRPDGSERVIRSRRTVTRDEAGAPVRMVGVGQDITEQKRLETAAAESAALLLRAEAMAHTGAWSLDLATNKVTASRELYLIHGLDPKGANERTDPQTFRALVHPDDRALVDRVQAPSSERSVHDAIEFRIEREGGGERVLRSRHEVLFDETGAAVEMVGTAQDITGREKDEMALKRLYGERSHLVQRLVEAQEGERQQIAYDLHDGVAQHLTAAAMFLDVYALEREDRQGEAEGYLRRAKQSLDIVLRETQRIMSGLRPPALDDLGLAGALQGALEDLRAVSDGKLEIDSDLSNVRLSGDVEILLFRIAQEALNNALKHASATHIQVSLHMEGSRLTLAVRDNGEGFDRRAEAGPGNRPHMGLESMQERAKLIGATCEVIFTPGQGTTVRVMMPVPE